MTKGPPASVASSLRSTRTRPLRTDGLHLRRAESDVEIRRAEPLDRRLPVRQFPTFLPASLFRRNPAMKLVCFDDYRLGVLKDPTALVDITSVVRDAGQGDPRLLMNRLIEDFASYRGRIEQSLSNGKVVPLDSVK